MGLFQFLPCISIELICVILAASCAVYVVYVYFFHPLSTIPRLHWSTPLSRLHYLYIIYSGTRRQKLLDAHIDSNGVFHPVIRAGPNEVSVMSTESARTTLNFERPTWYNVFKNYGRQNMFCFQSAQSHLARRRIYAKDYTKTAIAKDQVQNMVRTRVSKLHHFLVGQSRKAYGGMTSPLTVRDLFRALAADIQTAFCFSESNCTDYLDNLKKSGEHTLDDLRMRDLDFFMEDYRGTYFFWESEAPFKYIKNLISPETPRMAKAAEDWVSRTMVDYEHRVNSDSALIEKQSLSDSGIYGKLYSWTDKANGTQMPRTERASEIMDHVGAGQDSTAMVLEFTVRALSTHPEIQERLREELQNLAPGDLGDASYSSIDKLQYLNAVVLEGLRLVDEIESCQSRVIPKEGWVIEGHYIPGGTIAAAIPFLVHRQQDIFPDPARFNPDRWLLNEEKYKCLYRNLLTFSWGPRACIGKDLAMAALKFTLGSIYKDFTTELHSPSGPDGAQHKAQVTFRHVGCE